MWGTYEDKFKQARLLYTYMYTHPGKKLSFMGNEIAQFIEWDYKREIDWFLLDYPIHKQFNDFMIIILIISAIVSAGISYFEKSND